MYCYINDPVQRSRSHLELIAMHIYNAHMSIKYYDDRRISRRCSPCRIYIAFFVFFLKNL
jgi:hypothetical protein